MINKYKYDKLLYNLPDFILGKLDDLTLISRIEIELERNKAFKDEYLSLKNTMNVMNSSVFESPDELYFSSLSAKINKRISLQNEKHEGFSLSAFIGKYRNVLIASFIVLIFAVLYLLSNKNGIENPGNKIITSEQNKSNENSSVPQISENNFSTELKQKQESAIDDTLKTDVRISDNKYADKKVKEKKLKYKKPADEENADFEINNEKPDNGHEISSELLTDNYDILDEPDEESNSDIMIIDEVIDEDTENEFNQLSPEDQKEIIDNLIKSQI